MANNTQLNPGGTGDVIRTIDESGVKTQVVALAGTRDSGLLGLAKITAEGHVEVEIRGPRLPFGSLHTESLTPIFQVDAIYGINPTELLATTALSGTSTAATNLFTCATGTTSLAFASLQTRKRLRYRAGQGLAARFTALWSATSPLSITLAGLGTAESGVYFGYYNGVPYAPSSATSAEFGVLHVRGGVRKIVTLTVTTKSSTTNDITITLNSVVFTVTGITNGATTTTTAYELSTFTYAGWTAMQRGATVVFVAADAGTKTGTYAISQTGGGAATGTYATTAAGVASTDTFIPQSTWNGDKLDGTGASGVTLDPTKGNVFQIGVQYLGFGAITFAVETAPSANSASFITVHTIKFPNTQTYTNVTQPSMPFTMAAYSAGSTTNTSVSCASLAGFIEGAKKLTGPRMSYDSTRNNYVQSGTYYPLMTVRNDTEYGGRANQAVVQLISVGCAHGDATPVAAYLIRNATLAGPVSYAQWSTNSCTYVDIGATTCTLPSNQNKVLTLPMGNGGEQLLALADEITIQPGETITLAMKSVTGTTVWVMGNINTREDQ